MNERDRAQKPESLTVSPGPTTIMGWALTHEKPPTEETLKPDEMRGGFASFQRLKPGTYETEYIMALPNVARIDGELKIVGYWHPAFGGDYWL